MRLQFEGKTKRYIFEMGFKAIENSKQMTGFTNYCKDSLFIPMLDYDTRRFADVIGNKRYLEEKYGIFFDLLFTTGKGFHLVSFDKVPYHYLRDILDDSLCDPNFIAVPLDSVLGRNTLRISRKNSEYPKFAMQFKNIGHREFKMSNAHYLLLNKIYPEIQRPQGDFDVETEVELSEYWTK